MKKLLTALAATLLASTGALAADFSFSGNFVNDNDKLAFNFVVGAQSLVTLKTLSYAGGTNSAGQTIARGGFDPILSLYSSAGTRINFNDDGGFFLVPIDLSGRAWDTFLQSDLGAGTYTVIVTQFNNFAPDQLPGAFVHDGNPNFRNGFTDVSQSAFSQRDSHWAFDILNVSAAVQDGVPEPMTWVLMIGGFGAVGLTARRRRSAAARVPA